MALTPQASFAYYVPDPGAAADWYREKLGFQIYSDRRSADGTRYVAAGPPGADWQLIFGDATVHGEGELADRFRAELGFAPHFMLVCDDLDATVRDLKSKGVEVGEPFEMPFGQAVSFKDLYGDAVTLTDRTAWSRLRAT